MLERAGLDIGPFRSLSQLVETGGDSQADFQALQHTLALIYHDKAKSYGRVTAHLRPDRPGFDVSLLYNDLYRKWTRLDNQVWSAGPDKVAPDDLVDTLSDLGVYSVIALQKLDRMRGEG
jgi:hypothetical protein